MAIQVSIVEDDEQIRTSLFDLISDAPGYSCVAAYPTAEQALKFLPSHPPDVVLVDIHLPKMSGVECARRLKAELPDLQIVMHTVYEDSETIFQALEAGASGYLLKRTPPAKLLEALAEVRQGGAPMSMHIARKVVQSFRRRPSTEASESLAAREQEVLDYVAQGYINKEIADAMGLSVETVRGYLKNIYDKLHVRSRTEAVVKYLGK